jgi:hypothetical protein
VVVGWIDDGRRSQKVFGKWLVEGFREGLHRGGDGGVVFWGIFGRVATAERRGVLLQSEVRS